MDHSSYTAFLWLVMVSLELHHMYSVLLPGEACVESMKLSHFMCICRATSKQVDEESHKDPDDPNNHLVFNYQC